MEGVVEIFEEWGNVWVVKRKIEKGKNNVYREDYVQMNKYGVWNFIIKCVMFRKLNGEGVREIRVGILFQQILFSYVKEWRRV